MLFILDEDIVPVCSFLEGSKIEGLQNLLLSVRRGEHALVGPSAAFDALAGNQALGLRERAMAQHLLGRRSELGRLPGLVKRKVTVKADSAFRTAVRNDDSWCISVDQLARRFTSKIALLAENILDAELYLIAAEHYRSDVGLRGLICSSTPRGGGGSQMDVELDRILGNGGSAVAISDSDRFHPSDQPNAVALRCQELSRRDGVICWHYCLSCYAAENLVPSGVFLEACRGAAKFDEVERINKIDKTCALDGRPPSQFFSLKDGLTLSKIFSFANREKRQSWLAVVSELSRNNHQYSDCVEAGACEKVNCACVISAGFGAGCLRLIKDWCDNTSFNRSKQAFGTSSEWIEIGRLVFEAGLAFPPQRI